MRKLYQILNAGMLSLVLASGTAHAFDHKNNGSQILVTENSPDIFISENDTFNLENIINRAVQELVNPTNVQKTTEYLSELTRYQDYFTRAGVKTGIDELLLKALVWHESLVDLKAVSPKGAKGLCQFMGATAKEKGIKINQFKDYRSHPVCIEKAADYIKELYGRLGEDILLALMSYNAGPNRIETAIKEYEIRDVKSLKGIPDETKTFIVGVLSRNRLLRNERKFGIYPDKKPLFSLEENKSIPYKINPGDTIYGILRLFGSDINEIMKINPALRDPRMINTGDTILVPINY